MIERLERLEPLEPASLKVFTLNFEPGTLNGCYLINVLNEAKRWNRWNDWNIWNGPQY